MRMVILAVIAAVVFEVFVLAFAASADKRQVRAMPKWAWILVCLFAPILGGVAYLIFGRPIKGLQTFTFDEPVAKPKSAGKAAPFSGFGQTLKNFLGLDGEDDFNRPEPSFTYRPEGVVRRNRPVAPDDDPEFLAELDRKLKGEVGGDAEDLEDAEDIDDIEDIDDNEGDEGETPDAKKGADE